MSGEVRARVAAVTKVRDAVGSFGRTTEQAIASARSDARAEVAFFEMALVERQRDWMQAVRRVEMAEMELSRCRENCGGLQQAVSAARVEEQRMRQRHEQAKHAREECDRVCGELLRSLGSRAEAVQSIVARGRGNLATYLSELQAYLAKGGTS